MLFYLICLIRTAHIVYHACEIGINVFPVRKNFQVQRMQYSLHLQIS